MKPLPCILAGVLVFLLPPLADAFPLDGYVPVFVLVWSSLAVMLAAAWGRPSTRCRFLTTTDLAAGLYLAWGVLLLLGKGNPYDPLQVIEWAGLILLYAGVRLGCDAEGANYGFILGALTLSGITEAVRGLLQLYGWADSNHLLFGLTGSFFNPGHLGQWLTLCLVAAVELATSARGRFLRVSAGLAALLIGYIWIRADSRTAWIGAGAALAYLGYGWLRARGHRVNAAVWTAGATLTAAALIGAYLYRPASAGGRLFIWRVSTGLARQSPVTGHGPGSFPQLYMWEQARYFDKHPNAPQIRTAGNNSLAFNEYLRVAIEEGIVGLLLLLGMGASAFSSRGGRPVKALLLAWGVFAFFSYPGSLLPFKAVLAVVLALLSGRRVARMRMPATSICATVAAVILLCLTIPLWRQYRTIADALHAHHHGPRPQKIEAGSVLFKSRAEYVVRLAYRSLAKQDTAAALPLLKRVVRLGPSSERLCDLGECYRRAGLPDQAERAFCDAGRMTPVRLRPLYCQMKLYAGAGDTLRAARAARLLLEHPAGALSSHALEMRREARAYLVR